MSAAYCCIVCSAPMKRGLLDWHYVCGACRYEASTLQPRINEHDAHGGLSEEARALALERVRKRNFRQLLAMMQQTGLTPGSSILDVGSAHGWFLEAAGERYRATGIEPDARMAWHASARGLTVRPGFFPQALESAERFDAIVFNDVIEHIPDIDAALASCVQHLRPGGLLVLNLPSSGGPFYRMSKLLGTFGCDRYFRRMWQEGLPSPHVHYFTPANLCRLTERHGLRHLRTGRLEAVTREGLRERLSYVGAGKPAGSPAEYLAIVAMLPLLRLLPSDIFVQISTPNAVR